MSEIDKAAVESRRQFGEWAKEHDYTDNFSNWFIWWRGRKPLMDRIDRLTAERDALAKDAARYRWIRAHTTGERDTRGRQEFSLPDPHPLGNIMKGSVAQHLDAAIDQAMEKAD